MVAPNGARLGPADHPALPVTVEATVACAVACHAAGADGLHAHVRDADGRHVLDAGLYRELIAETARRVPDMQVQVTTEAVGRYTAAEQRALIRDLRPASVSVALREITSDADDAANRRLWSDMGEAGMLCQHILYAPEDVQHLAHLVRRGDLPADGLAVLYVLGRYTEGQQSAPSDLDPFLACAKAEGLDPDWAMCAFGRDETACLSAGLRKGGKVRVGFENNRLMASGDIARDNAERVREIRSILGGA